MCRAEYREGVEICGDCKVPLVAELPLTQEAEYIEYVELLSTFNPADIAVIKSILESEGITFYFQGEHFMHMSPCVLPAKLMVAKENAESARELLQDLKLSIGPVNLAEKTEADEGT
jgi:hypothetical protein